MLAAPLLAASCQSTNQPTANLAQNNQLKNYNYNAPLLVGKNLLQVEIADTPDKQEQGLSGRPPLTDEQGMLFDFGPTPSLPTFWMKDMKFNLDLIWIYDNKIVGITPGVPAPLPGQALKDLPLYHSPAPVTEVLEVNAGWAQKYRVTVGDAVSLQK